MSDTKATIVVVDRSASLVMELRDDSKSTFIEATGLSTYSNSKAGVASYIAIFENLWKQTELYDQLKESKKQLEAAYEQVIRHDKMQEEFIKIAAHELLISGMSTTTSTSIKLEYSHSQDIFVRADRERITQVINNLLNNAIKFTKKGTISTSLEKKKEQDGDKEYIVVGVKDTGQGIDSEILPNLFTKFATKSQTRGTGVGLFISKNIIEAHDGKIWAQNNNNGIGATFTFSLPITNE